MYLELELLERRQQNTEAKLVDAYRSYRKAFGVHVRSSHEDVLEFTFTDIERNAPEREHVVEVQVLDNNYKGAYIYIHIYMHISIY